MDLKNLYGVDDELELGLKRAFIAIIGEYGEVTQEILSAAETCGVEDKLEEWSETPFELVL